MNRAGSMNEAELPTLATVFPSVLVDVVFTTRNLIIHDGFLMTFSNTVMDELVQPRKPAEAH